MAAKHPNPDKPLIALIGAILFIVCLIHPVQAANTAEKFLRQAGKVLEARQAGARLSVYLWGKKDILVQVRRALAMGAQGISCDHPGYFLPLLNDKSEFKKS
jgi:hypothetical protein